jgi:hypothetical protein
MMNSINIEPIDRTPTLLDLANWLSAQFPSGDSAGEQAG